MKVPSGQRAAALAFLMNWWPKRSKAQALLREWAEVFERGWIGRHDRLVLADLARMCNAGDSCFDKNSLRMAADVGRQEVWLQIRQRLNIDLEETDVLLQETEE